MIDRRQFVQGSIAAAALAALPHTPAFAQAIEQVKVLYGFPAGSAGDIAARRVADRFAGTAFSKAGGVVETRAGAGGRIALDGLKAGPQDGSVIAHTPFSALSLYPHIYAKLSYDPFKDFVCLGTTSLIHHGLCVGPAVPESVKDVRGFVAWCKANPDKANYGSPAAGSTPHFIGALLGLNTSTDIKHVPYRGSIPGITDVVGGQVPAMICPHGDQIANHKAGKLRILATSGKTRSPFVPDVATFAEQGMPELTVEEWFGYVGPSKMPPALVTAANQAIAAALKDAGVLTALQTVGLIPLAMTTAEMTASMKAEHDRWGPLIKRIGFTAES